MPNEAAHTATTAGDSNSWELSYSSKSYMHAFTRGGIYARLLTLPKQSHKIRLAPDPMNSLNTHLNEHTLAYFYLRERQSLNKEPRA